jgi:outer membrane protein OmpA-like peptidoglycan-associated protein/Tol biopolymer transport system component
LTVFLTCSLHQLAAQQSQKRKAIRILQNPPSVTIVKLDVLNSPVRESNLALTPDGNTLYFGSARGEQSWTRYDEVAQRNDFDIWYSQRVDGIWQKPRILDASINTEHDEDEPVVSPDGQTLYFLSARSGWELNGGPYYTAELRGKKWESVTGLGGGITQFFAEQLRDAGAATTELTSRLIMSDGMTISPDGTTMLFVCGVNNPKKMNLDIFFSKKIENTWGAVQPLAISSPKNERSVFLAPDGKTLYFSSNGLGGLGGYDIFKTTLNPDGTCGEIVNLGAPFNSSEDDYGFVLTADGKEAFFIRGGDIHAADLSMASSEMKPRPMIILSGMLKDKTTGAPLEGTVEINELVDSESSAATQPFSITARSNALTGAYSLLLKPGKKYVQSAFASKYKNYAREFEVEADARDNITATIEMELRPPKPPKTTASAAATKGQSPASSPKEPPVLPVIYFDSDQFTFGDEYLDKLDQLADFLRTNPTHQVEIFGFADDRGSFEYNLKLSQRRVNDVVDYLLSVGIERKQMVLQWFGEESPAAPNSTEAGRRENRRVELRVFRKLEAPPSTPASPVPSNAPIHSKPASSSTSSSTAPNASPQPRPQNTTRSTQQSLPPINQSTAQPTRSMPLSTTRATLTATRATINVTQATTQPQQQQKQPLSTPQKPTPQKPANDSVKSFKMKEIR